MSEASELREFWQNLKKSWWVGAIYISFAALMLYVGLSVPEPRGVVVYDYYLCPVNGRHFDPDEMPMWDELVIGWLVLWPHSRLQADAYVARYPEASRHLAKGGCLSPEGQ